MYMYIHIISIYRLYVYVYTYVYVYICIHMEALLIFIAIIKHPSGPPFPSDLNFVNTTYSKM